MEIKINIPQNDYVQPTEVREEVVQMICDTFLNGGILRVKERDPQVWIGIYNNKYVFIENCPSAYINPIRVRGVEMKAAFNALSQANYYIYTRVINLDKKSQKYLVDKKPYYPQFTHTNEFNLFID